MTKNVTDWNIVSIADNPSWAQEAADMGFDRLYLVTDHVGLYEHCGWEYVGDVHEEDGGLIRMYGVDALDEEASCRIEEIDLAADDTLLSQLVACWRRSVEATHDFLTPADVERIAAYVPDAIRSVPRLAVCCQVSDCGGGSVLGFVGLDGSKVEMLFVDSAARGQGIGTRLLDYAVREWGATAVDVNEQNHQAVGFYRHYGFEVASRSETDDMGDPFPLLHMSLVSAKAQGAI